MGTDKGYVNLLARLYIVVMKIVMIIIMMVIMMMMMMTKMTMTMTMTMMMIMLINMTMMLNSNPLPIISAVLQPIAMRGSTVRLFKRHK